MADGGVADEPGVGVLRRAGARVAGGRCRSARRCRSCRRPRRRGSAAEVPVPNSHHRDHHLLHLAGDVRLVTRTNRGLLVGQQGGDRPAAAHRDRRRRRRSSPAAWPGPCPGRSPRSRPPGRRRSCSADGIVLSAAPGIDGGWLKPKRSAIATSRCAAELGAERREHRVARDGEGVEQRAAAGLAAGVLQREAVDRRRGLRSGTWSPSLTIPACSAAVAVMIFIVEPGGCSAEKAMPASASSAPVRGFITVDPGVLAAHRARSRRAPAPGRSSSCTGVPCDRLGAAPARAGRPAACRPGVPASWLWKIRSRPSLADLGVGRIALRRRSRAPASAGIGPSVPTICSATSGIGEVRSGPSASGVPSLASSVAARRQRRSAGSGARRGAGPGTAATRVRSGPGRPSRCRSAAPRASRAACPRAACATRMRTGDRVAAARWPRAARAATVSVAVAAAAAQLGGERGLGVARLRGSGRAARTSARSRRCSQARDVAGDQSALGPPRRRRP